MTRALLNQAFEQLSDWLDFGGTHMPFKTHDDDIWTNTENTITEIREYLNQPEQEPVAQIDEFGVFKDLTENYLPNGTKLYTKEQLDTEQKPICPMCASKIDEAAGVDLVSLKQQLAASQLREQQLRDAFQTFIDEHEDCSDADDWMASMCSLEAVHEAENVLNEPHETSALDALVKDAERYRWLKDNCSYSYAMQPDSPAEHGIEYQWQQGTYEERNRGIDGSIDAAIDAARGE